MDVQVPERRTAEGQSLTPPGRGLGPLVQSFCRWIRDSVIRRRLFQTSAIVLMFCGMAIYVGARSGSGTLRQQGARHPNSESAATVSGSGLPSARPHAASTQDLLAQAISKNSPARNSVESFAYVVQPQDTLRDLCVATLGRYDSTAISEIRELNPGLKNPEHLHPGQEIRLPVSATK
jgi:LysM repeat protein